MVFASTVEITRGGDIAPQTKHSAPDAAETPVSEAMTFSIPAPIASVRANIKEFEEDSINKLLTRYDGVDVLPNGWREGPCSKGIQVVYGEVTGSEWYTMKTTGTLQVSAEKAASILMDYNMVPKFDDMTREVKPVEKLSDASEDGRHLIATRSVEYVPERKGFVRATIIISGYVVVPHPTDPNMCEMSVIAHMDLGGNLPAMVVRYLGLSAPIKLVEKIHEITLSS
ncbi:hypothetical protein JM16_005628 [Phytophthora kernoviae]|uniref:START domain-containing protein n=1 Tax=Phytophthora kernoviae TaxID=325452 RepID=A0A8T0LT59_9STRA|nr:hypothetical protein JM16_005628 [Phytophthora kernoviae]